MQRGAGIFVGRDCDFLHPAGAFLLFQESAWRGISTLAANYALSPQQSEFLRAVTDMKAPGNASVDVAANGEGHLHAGAGYGPDSQPLQPVHLTSLPAAGDEQNALESEQSGPIADPLMSPPSPSGSPQAEPAPVRPEAPPGTAAARPGAAADLPDAAQAVATATTSPTMLSYAAAITDGLAAVLSLASARLSAAPSVAPDAVKITGALSGGLWALGAGLQELGNSPRHRAVTVANFFGGTAGILSLAASLLLNKDATDTASGSGATWIVNGAGTVARAVWATEDGTVSRVLLGSSGAANMVAGAWALMAAVDSADSNTTDAEIFVTISSAFWIVGAVVTIGAVWTASCHAGRRPLPDVEG
jgi:hypothetical protein